MISNNFYKEWTAKYFKHYKCSRSPFYIWSRKSNALQAQRDRGALSGRALRLISAVWTGFSFSSIYNYFCLCERVGVCVGVSKCQQLDQDHVSQGRGSAWQPSKWLGSQSGVWVCASVGVRQTGRAMIRWVHGWVRDSPAKLTYWGHPQCVCVLGGWCVCWGV